MNFPQAESVLPVTITVSDLSVLILTHEFSILFLPPVQLRTGSGRAAQQGLAAIQGQPITPVHLMMTKNLLD